MSLLHLKILEGLNKNNSRFFPVNDYTVTVGLMSIIMYYFYSFDQPVVKIASGPVVSEWPEFYTALSKFVWCLSNILNSKDHCSNEKRVELVQDRTTAHLLLSKYRPCSLSYEESIGGTAFPPMHMQKIDRRKKNKEDEKDRCIKTTGAIFSQNSTREQFPLKKKYRKNKDYKEILQLLYPGLRKILTEKEIIQAQNMNPRLDKRGFIYALSDLLLEFTAQISYDNNREIPMYLQRGGKMTFF